MLLDLSLICVVILLYYIPRCRPYMCRRSKPYMCALYVSSYYYTISLDVSLICVVDLSLICAVILLHYIPATCPAAPACAQPRLSPTRYT